MAGLRQARQRSVRGHADALQGEICAALDLVETELGGTAEFGRDTWVRDGGGGGTTRVVQGGNFLEKGGVAVSVVHGTLAPDFAATLPGTGTEFFATGISLVLHPLNPNVPTVHANFRYIEHGERAWFGGGADLTPYYFHEEDRSAFHAVWRKVCECHPSVANYAAMAEHCDRYFYLPHRGERRGIGGIFFDNMWDDELQGEAAHRFWEAAGSAFVDAYLPIVRRRISEPYSEAQRRWQQHRRGRYVEFNLLYDRGTIFGLRTGGRTESILMSLPPQVRWGYCEEPAPGTPEADLLEHLRLPISAESR